MHTGEKPTKKNTGELEPILPDWLRDARQQSRNVAEEDAKKEATKPKIPKAEPLDLLAGLAFQAASDEEEVPDWLAAISPVEKKTPTPSKPAEEEPPDFFAQFREPAQETATPPLGDVPQSETPAWTGGSTDETRGDELTGWMSQASAQPDELPHFDTNISQEPAAPAAPEDLSWLHDLESSAKQSAPPSTPSADMDWMSNISSSSAQPLGAQEDLSWLNSLGGVPASPNEPATPQEDMSWLDKLGGAPEPSQPTAASEDMSWLNNLGGTSAPAQPAAAPEDMSWLNNLGGTPASSFDEPAPSKPASSQEDLSWLNNLAGAPASPQSEPARSQPASSQEDLSWLNNLGGTPAPSFNELEPSKPASSDEDLSWLNNLGATPISASAAPAQPASSQEDLSWLNNLGGTSTPPSAEFESVQPTSSQEDLAWLNNLGDASALPTSQSVPEPSAASQEDLDWLNNLGGTPPPSAIGEPLSTQADSSWLNDLTGTPPPSVQEPEPTSSAQSVDLDWLTNLDNQQEASPAASYSPRRTAPLSSEAQDSMPDWLKSATAEPSMPPLGATSMDWFSSKDQQQDAAPQFDELRGEPASSPASGQTQGMPGMADQNDFSAITASTLSNQDVDSLFAVEMPDWLSQPEPTEETPASQANINIPSEPSDSLAPVNLPSWVQAMRPMEAVINEASAISADQTTEREGPLAGFRGLIPFAPIGSAQRPKPISLKLQATEDQQTSAALLEQIITGEATARPLKIAASVISQRALRWTLSALFVLVLGVMVGAGTRLMPVLVSSTQMAEISNTSTLITNIPDGAPVLVVMDYEPALAGEMEAVAGPLLDQMVVLRHPTFTFVATSPNGSALVERLLTNTGINEPAPDGLGYQIGSQYFNVGYLPGGSAGVRGFIEGPKTVMPSVNVNLFSDFAAVVVITDHAESGLVWIEQLELMKQTDPALASQPLLAVASAQAGPLLQPYVLSKQVDEMLSGLPDAARYEFVNNSRPGITRSYWDAFGVGLFMAITAIVLGSLWSVFTTVRARRAGAE